MTPAQLADIKRRMTAGGYQGLAQNQMAQKDLTDLIAEVERLQRVLAAIALPERV